MKRLDEEINKQEAEAEGFKHYEIDGRSRDEVKGVSPAFYPIRKRGYYRALKAEKPWALVREYMGEITTMLCKDLFYGVEKND